MVNHNSQQPPPQQSKSLGTSSSQRNNNNKQQLPLPNASVVTTASSLAKCPVINWLAPLQCISQYPKITTTPNPTTISDNFNSSSSSSPPPKNFHFITTTTTAATSTSSENQKNDTFKGISSSASVEHLHFLSVFIFSIIFNIAKVIPWTIIRIRLAGL